MNMTRIAAGSGSGEPSPASSARQASIAQPRPASTQATAPATSYHASLASAARTSSHCEASPYTASPAATASSPARSHGFLVRSRTDVAYSPAPNGRISPMNGDPATRQEVLRLAGLIYVSTQVKPHVVRENEKAAPVRRVSLVAWTCLVIVYFVWGSTYPFIRIGVETMPPLLMAAARFL